MHVSSDYFDQTFNLQQLAIHIATKTVLFPGLLGFSIGSRNSLKAWLAVQDAPAAPRLDKDQEKKLKRKMVAATFLILSAVIGLEFYLFAQGSQLSIDRFFTYLFSYVFQVSLMGLFVSMTQATEWTAHRGVAGILHYRPYNLSRPKALVSVVAATAVNVAAYYDAHWAFGSALIVSVIVARLSNTPARRFSLRGCIFCLVIVTALIVALFAIVAAAATKFMRQVDNGEIELPEDNGEGFEIDGFASPNVMKFVNYFITAMYALVPGTLIAGCYRFDYSNAVESSPDLFTPVSLKTVEVPTNNFKFLSSGVVLPSSLPEHFSKPYFTVALWAWLLAQIAAAGMFALIVPFPRHMIDGFNWLSFGLSSIFLLVGLSLTAAFRGEFKKFWTYREVWVPKAEKGIALEENASSTSSMEETLPAYEVVSDVKQPLLDTLEDAPAYKV